MVNLTMIDASLLADLVTELPASVRLQRLVRALREQFRCGAVALLRQEGDTLCPVAIDGLVKEALGRRFLIAHHPRLATLLTSRNPVRFEPGSPLPDPYDGLLDGHAGEPLPVHDCMGISLHIEGQCWGVLTLDALHAGTFAGAATAQLAETILLVEAAVRVTRLEQERNHLRLAGPDQSPRQSAHEYSEILGQSEAILRLLQELAVVADSDLPVLLLGETGVGKELFARHVHRSSPRAKAALVHVNCAALPETLAESELFGHVKGAFSGATSDRAGRFEAADGGTLFLDEVGELPLLVQAKLLRALQNGEIQRLGEDTPRRVNVRVIAATNRDLRESLRDGSFRADLYHRLSVYPVPIPPLRERGNDVLLLAGHFLELNRARLGVRSLRLSGSAEEALFRYSWPGNVRELEHVISRAALKALSRGAARRDIITLDAELLDLEANPVHSTLDAAAIPPSIIAGAFSNERIRGGGIAAPSTSTTTIAPLQRAVEHFQRQYIQAVLDTYAGNWAAAARQLQIDPSNLHKLARKIGLKK